MAKNFSTFADLVTWMRATNNDVIINANGTLMKTFIFEGKDGSCMTEEELDAYYVGLNNIFKRLRTGMMLWTEMQKRKIADAPDEAKNRFDVPVLNELEAAREKTLAAGALYRNTYYLTVCFQPESEALQKVSKILDTSNEDLVTKIRAAVKDYRETLRSSRRDVIRWDAAAKETVENIKLLEGKFLDETDQLVRGLSQYFTDIRPATREETYTYLHSTISDRYFKIRSDPQMFISEMLSDSVFLGGREPKLGDKFVGVVGIKDLLAATQAFMLSRLNSLSSEYRFVTRYLPLSKDAAVAELSSIAKKFSDSKKNFWTLLWEAKERVTTDKVDNLDAEQDEVETNEALSGLVADDYGVGYCTMDVVLLNEDKARLTDDLSEIRSLINDLGFVATIEKDNAAAAWFSTIPSVYKLNVRNYLINSTNYACISPFGAYWQGEKKISTSATTA